MKYYVYITTNPNQSSLYVGMTNNLEQRIIEHYLNRGNPKTHAGKYYCYCLLYYEEHKYVNNAIAREKEIKKWRREKKAHLINTFNPLRRSLNAELFGKWPLPGSELHHR
jgi:putative endonuclease